jgi:hypothetical protein
MPVGTRATSTPLSEHEISASETSEASRNTHNRKGRGGATQRARGGKRRGTQSEGNRRPTKRSVRIEEPSNRSHTAEETARLRARILELEEQVDTQSRREALELAAADRAKQAKKIALKEHRQAAARETLGFDVEIRTPKTSEIAQEEASPRSRLEELGSEGDGVGEYDIVLTGALVVNRRNESKKPFPTRTRSEFDLRDIEQWISAEMEGGSPTASIKLESHEYEIRRRRVHVHPTSGRFRKRDFDIEDFGVEMADLVLEQADIVRRSHPKISVTILIEVSCFWDRKLVEKARKEAENSASHQSATLAEGSRVRGRSGVISAELKNQLDGQDYRELEEKIKDQWTCTSTSCPHFNKLCWISPDSTHYSFGYAEMNVWIKAIQAQEAFPHLPSKAVVRTFEKLGPVNSEASTKKSKKWDMQSIMEQTQEVMGFMGMMQSQQSMLNVQKMFEKVLQQKMEQDEKDSSRRSRSPARRRESSRSPVRQRGRSRSQPHQQEYCRSIPRRSHSRSPRRHRSRSHHRTPLVRRKAEELLSSSPFPIVDGDFGDEVIRMALTWKAEQVSDPQRQRRWQAAAVQIGQADWSIEDCKALRDTSSHNYKLAVNTMKISDGIAREIPEVISSFKTVYLQLKLQEQRALAQQRKEALEKEKAAAGLTALRGVNGSGSPSP